METMLKKGVLNTLGKLDQKGMRVKGNSGERDQLRTERMLTLPSGGHKFRRKRLEKGREEKKGSIKGKPKY